MAKDTPIPPSLGLPTQIQIPGQRVITVDVFVFQCPRCGHRFRYDDRAEPMCTGPSWRDEHPPEVMRCLGKAQRQVLV